MTGPYLDYSAGNYADWKARSKRLQDESAVGGLLRVAKKVAGIEDEPAPSLMGTPAFNPEAPDPRAQMTPPAPSPLLAEDPTHAHKKGWRGGFGLRHLLGTDRVSEDVAQNLDPDQLKRLVNMPSLLQFGAGGEQELAQNMIDLRTQKKARDKAARDERMESQIQAAASQMEPQAGLEFAERMRGMYGIGNPQAANAAANLRDPMRLPVQETFGNAQAMRIGGKDVMVQHGSLGTQRVVPDAEPMPREATPTVDNTIVAIDDGAGNPVYVPRAEAIGKKPWQAPNRPLVATARVQETYRKKSAVLDDLNKAIDVYRVQLDSTGIELMPGAARSRLTGSYANLKLLAKEAANLGALTGPDVKILEELFNDPASLASAGMNILESGKRKQSLLEQLDQYRSIINGNRATLEDNYRREMEMSGGDSGALRRTSGSSEKTFTKAQADALGPADTQELVSKGYRIVP